MRFALFPALALFASAAHADIRVDFQEGAPKDRFVITNTGTCDMGPFALTLSLGGSDAGLIFDVTANGAGVEVFQPLELTTGAKFLEPIQAPKDGDTQVVMQFLMLPAAASASFTIDVDDTLTNGPSGQIIVRGSEINGATVQVNTNGGTAFAAFDTSAQAVVSLEGCGT